MSHSFWIQVQKLIFCHFLNYNYHYGHFYRIQLLQDFKVIIFNIQANLEIKLPNENYKWTNSNESIGNLSTKGLFTADKNFGFTSIVISD